MTEQIQHHVLAKYKVIKKIGSGAYGHVFKVIDRKTKKVKALKKNFDAFNNSTDAQRTYRQIMFLLKLKHPNIINLEQIIQAVNGKDIYLVFQHMDADLHRIIRQNLLTQCHKKYILYQIAKSIYYLHNAGLIHRDLKPSNVLVNQSCDAKLCDFGLVRSILDVNQFKKIDILTQYIATRWYRAPQLLLSSTKYCKGIDIWSFGCLLGQMIKGKPMFPGTSTINQLQRILMWTGPPSQNDINSLNTQFGKQFLQTLLKTKKSSKKQFFNQIDPDCLDLISKCLQFNSDKRISIEQIIIHPYLSEFYNKTQIIKSKEKIKIQIDDNKRLSIKDYKSLIYQQINKRNRLLNTLNLQIKQLNQSNFFRIRERPKKTLKTEETDNNIIKQTSKIYPKKKISVCYQHDSKTVDIKNSQLTRKKTFYKAQSLNNKNLRTFDKNQLNHNIQKTRKQDFKQLKKAIIIKQNNRNKSQWNKGKRSVTEGDKNIKLLSNYGQFGYFNKK